MHTLLSSWRPDQSERLTDYVELTHDPHVPLRDRLSLRLGLWLLLTRARRAERDTRRVSRAHSADAAQARYQAVHDDAMRRLAQLPGWR